MNGHSGSFQLFNIPNKSFKKLPMNTSLWNVIFSNRYVPRNGIAGSKSICI